MEIFNLTAEENDLNKRLDLFICEKLIEFTRSRIQKLIEEQLISVNHVQAKSSYKLKQGDIVKVVLPELKPISTKPQNINLDIIYEDKHLIIINKPKGLVTHPAEGTKDGTLVNALLYHCTDLSGIGGAIRPGIVHRLDKDTTGLIMVAKNDRAHQELSKQIQAKDAKRFYKAVAIGNFPEDTGVIDLPIGRNKKDRKKMAVDNEGRNAVTIWKVLERFGLYTLLELELKTGRTHQIRVHLAHIKHGILGDEVYGPDIKLPLKLTGQALHAYKLCLKHPETGEEMQFTAPEHEEFMKLVSLLRQKKS